MSSSDAPHELAPEDVQASFCHVLVDEWKRQGVEYVALAPGSRSTPIALALARADGLTVDVFHDERSAAFAALGAGIASNRPAIVVCTSGTAAAHLHAAVIEADLSNVPLVVCTADRPPEARDVGAPQTIDQIKMFGSGVRWFHDPGVPARAASASWRSLAARVIWATASSRPGPVHLNLPFREPLVGHPIPGLTSSPTPVDRRYVSGRSTIDEKDLVVMIDLLAGKKGLLIVGRGCGDPLVIENLARVLAWPVVADPRSGCRGSEYAIHHADSILRDRTCAEELVPEVVLRIGEPPSSKVLAQWVTTSMARQVHLTGSGASFDPDHSVTVRIHADPTMATTALSERLSAQQDRAWLALWMSLDRSARDALEKFDRLDAGMTGVGVGREMIKVLPRGSHLVLSSSMPVRDVEWFGGDTSHVTVHANRGANGIDGVIATAVGVARMSQATTSVLIGDVAAIHDASTLVSLAHRDLDIRIVLVNNDGGGIFHHLPQAESVEPELFERIYGTPHGIDFTALCSAAGLRAVRATTYAHLRESLVLPGPVVIEVTTSRIGDVETHRLIHALVHDLVSVDS